MSTYRNLSELLAGEDAESPYRLGRSLYKYVDCGPWITFLVPGMPDSFGRHEVYYDRPEARGWGATRWVARCTGVRIGSIVEGSDASATPATLTFPFAKDQFWQAVDHVNDEACALWDEANEESDE
jgi:hypothetical protein